MFISKTARNFVVPGQNRTQKPTPPLVLEKFARFLRILAKKKSRGLFDNRLGFRANFRDSGLPGQ